MYCFTRAVHVSDGFLVLFMFDRRFPPCLWTVRDRLCSHSSQRFTVTMCCAASTSNGAGTRYATWRWWWRAEVSEPTARSWRHAATTSAPGSPTTENQRRSSAYLMRWERVIYHNTDGHDKSASSIRPVLLTADKSIVLSHCKSNKMCVCVSACVRVCVFCLHYTD